MGNNGGGIPYSSNLVPANLELDSRLEFHCAPGISCFNACCKRADITLTPYDIIRLKDRLGKSSTAFLREHTVPFQMEQDGLPGVKLRTDNDGQCLFMTGAGCSVYEDRPTACRYYPLGHMAMHRGGEAHEETHYFLIREDHCMGHNQGRVLTIREFLQEQETGKYDETNQAWLQIMLKKRSSGPNVGRLPESSLQMFFMCSFDMDRFRRFITSDGFRNTYELDDSVYETLANGDIPLMYFGIRFMRQAFFGERTIPEREGAWENRVKEREKVWETRRQAEIIRRRHQVDEKTGDDG